MRPPDASITLDLPPETSKPNAGYAGNWQSKSRPAKKYAETNGAVVWSHAIELGNPKWKSVAIRLTFVMPPLKKGGSDKRSDPDNLIAWAKRSLDLLTVHGILDDDRDVVHLPPIQRRASQPIIGFKQSMPGLTIEIWQRREGECPFCGSPQLTKEPCGQ